MSDLHIGAIIAFNQGPAGRLQGITNRHLIISTIDTTKPVIHHVVKLSEYTSGIAKLSKANRIKGLPNAYVEHLVHIVREFERLEHSDAFPLHDDYSDLTTLASPFSFIKTYHEKVSDGRVLSLVAHTSPLLRHIPGTGVLKWPTTALSQILNNMTTDALVGSLVSLTRVIYHGYRDLADETLTEMSELGINLRPINEILPHYLFTVEDGDQAIPMVGPLLTETELQSIDSVFTELPDEAAYYVVGDDYLSICPLIEKGIVLSSAPLAWHLTGYAFERYMDYLVTQCNDDDPVAYREHLVSLKSYYERGLLHPHKEHPKTVEGIQALLERLSHALI